MAVLSRDAVAKTLTVRISQSSDDAEQFISSGSIFDSSTDLELLYDTDWMEAQYVGIRFQNITVAPGVATHSITATHTDAASNTSSVSGAVTLVVNSQPSAVASDFQSGTTTVTTVSTDVSITSVDLTKSFLVFSYTVDDEGPSQFLVRGDLTSSTNIHFERVGSSGSPIVTIAWYVAEFTSGVTVQRGNDPHNSATVNVPITAVDLSKSFPLISWQNAGSIWGTDDGLRARLTSATNLELDAVSAVSENVNWQVIEYDGAVVQRGQHTLGTGDVTATVAITAVDLSKSFVMVTNTNGGDGFPDDLGIQAEFSAANQLTFTRGSTGPLFEINWVVVEFTNDESVQSGSATFASGETVSNIPISSVDASKSIAFLSQHQRGDQGNVPSPDNPGHVWFAADLTSSTNLQLTRAVGSGSTAEVEWFVVDFSGQTDTPPPAAPVITAPSSPTNDTTPIISGTASEDGGTITLTSDIDGVFAPTATVAGGTWSIQLTSVLSVATHSITATHTDAAGNTSPVSSAVTLVVTASFTDNTSSAGLGSISNTYGVAWGDYNNDGYPDLYVAVANALYTNDGDGTFSAGPALTGNGRATHWGDYDNDGDLDFFATSDAQLSLNNGNNTFTLQNNASVGITYVSNLGDVSWLDYDNDGDLDIFAHNGASSGNRIYSNDGDGTFTTLTPSGINSISGNGEVTGVADYDNDGDTDIIFRIGSTVRILSNNGDKTFTLALTFSISDDGGGYNGIAWGDYDNDGDLDLYLGGIGANQLHRNNGDGTFTDVTAAAGVAGTSSNTKGVAWGDYDHDGDLDLFVAHANSANQLFRSNGNDTFTDVAVSVGLDESAANYGAVWADYDLDGDLDLFVGGSASNSKLFLNNQGDTDYLKVKVTGLGAGYSAKDGTGARVELYNSSGTTLHAVRELFGAEGFGSHSQRIQHFGLASAWGDGSGTYTVKVIFPSGTTVTRSNVVPTSESIVIGSNTLVNTIEITETVPAPTSAPTLDSRDARLFYGEGGKTVVRHRTWDNSVGSWSAEGLGPAANSIIKFTVNKVLPSGAEDLLGVLSDTGAGTDLDLIRWSGSAWSVDWSSTAIANANADKRGFDIEYEVSSGDALVVYSNNTATPVYRTRSGGSWSAETALPLNDGGGSNPDPNSGTVLWVELEQGPDADEIALAYVDANSDLVAIVWDGTQWLTASVSTLETNVKRNPGTGTVSNRAFDLAYEETTGDLMTAWSRHTTSGFWYSTQAAGSNTWSVAAQVAAAPTSGTPHYIDLASEPSGQRIAIGSFDMGDGVERLGLATWTGSAWVNAGEYDSQTYDVNDAGTGDFAGAAGWVGTSGTAVVFYPDNQTGTIDWARWTSAGGWAIQTDVTVAGKSYTESVQIESFTNADELLAIFSDSNSDLYAATYNGTSWTVTNSGSALETSVSSVDSAPLSFALLASDVTAPAAPVITALASPTNDTTPIISGTASEDGGTITLTSDIDGVLAPTTTVAAGAWSITLTSALTEGTHVITATHTDAAGNTSVASGSATLVVDMTAPTPAIASAETSPTSADPVPVTIDFGEVIDTATFDLSDVTVSSGTLQNLVNTGDDQNFTLEIAGPTDGGTLTAWIAAGQMTDAAGNNNLVSNALMLTIDRTAPAAPVITAPASPTNDTTPIISGTASEDGGTITLTSDLDGVLAPTATVTGGAWSIQLTSPLSIATHSLTATHTDSAANQSADSGAKMIDIVQSSSYDRSLWFATIDDVSGSGTPGITSWGEDDILEFSSATLILEPADTDGEISFIASLDSYFDDGVVAISGLHYVTRDITVGGGANTFDLNRGDVLFALDADESIGANFFEDMDIHVFRPATPGDYSSGSFFHLLDDVSTTRYDGITLVEYDTYAGDVLLKAGEFLFIDSVTNNEIRHFAPTGVGIGTTSGTTTDFLTTTGLFTMSSGADAIELIEVATTIGGQTLAAGTILVSILGDGSSVGDSPSLAVEDEDIFQLSVNTTYLGSATSSATATMLFDGSKINLSEQVEDINSITIWQPDPEAFRSKATGNWSTGSTWERFSGTSWIEAGTFPWSETAETITIQSGHTVTVDSVVGDSLIVDQMTIDSGGTVIVNRKTVVVDNTGTDFSVAGQLTINATLEFNPSGASAVIVSSGGQITNSGTFNATGSSTITFSSASNYTHSQNGGAFPKVARTTWSSGSTAIVTGVTTTIPGELGDSFHHFTWNSASQTAALDLNAAMTAIGGDLTITSTGTATLSWVQSLNTNLTIDGDYLQTGGTFIYTDGNGTGTMSAASVSVTGGALSLTTSTGTPNLSLTGTLTVSGGGSITETGTGSGSITFIGSSTQSIAAASGITNSVDLIVNNSGGIQLTEDLGAPRHLTGTAGIINLNAKNLFVGGNLSVNSDLTNPATITFNGTGTQNLSYVLGTLSLPTLVLDNSGGSLLLGTDLTVTTTASVRQGTLNVNSKVLTFPTGTTLYNAGTVTGNVIFKRLYSLAADGWRMLATPLDGINYSALNTDFHTQGASWADLTGGSATLQAPDFAVQWWSPLGGADATFTDGQGYIFYMYKELSGLSILPATWSVTGTVRSSAARALSWNTVSTDSYNFVGNRTTSNIDWDAAVAASTNLATTYSTWDPVLTSGGGLTGYKYYNSASGIGLAGRYIPPFTAFMVEPTASGGSLIFSTSEAANLQAANYFGKRDAVSRYLRFMVEGEGVAELETYLVFDDAATDGADDFDAHRMQPLADDYVTLVSISGGRQLAFDGRSMSGGHQQYALGLSTTKAGTYTLTWPDRHLIPDHWILSLFDRNEGRTIDMRQQSSYVFLVARDEATERSSGQFTVPDAIPRFTVAIATETLPASAPDNVPTSVILAQNYPNPFNPETTIRYSVPETAPVMLEILDVLGRRISLLVDRIEEPGWKEVRWDAGHLTSGMYFYRVTVGSQHLNHAMLLLR